MLTRYRLIIFMVMAFLFSPPASSALSVGPFESIGEIFKPPRDVVSTVRPDLSTYEFNRIAVLPFRNLTDEPRAGGKVAKIFYHELESYGRYKVMTPLPLEEEKVGLELSIEKDSVSRQSLDMIYSLITKAQEGEERAAPRQPEGRTDGKIEVPGKPAQYDAIVTGVITRFKDRDGNAILINSPASVSFEVFMFSVRDGAILWRAEYSETQEPLLDNLLLVGRFLKRGGAWQTNEKLSEYGIAKMMRTFPGIKAGK